MGAVGTADIAKIAEALRESGKAADATTKRVLIESANYLLTEMELRAPVDSGELRRSLSIRVETDRVIIGPNVPYASYVEFGTRPHVIKPKRPDGMLRFKVDGKVVYARVVHHPGTQPQPFVQDSFDAWVQTLGRDVAQGNVDYFVKEANGGRP